MDDFLHNLRSGKLKQSDRGRRDYTDYKGPQRRAGSDRRRTDYYAKVTNENFALIKDVLDVLVENQKRIADTATASIKTEARIADALEAIAVMMERRWGYADVLSHRTQAVDEQSDPDTADDTIASEAKAESMSVDDDDDEQATAGLLDMIEAMRTEGSSWEKIARHFDDQNIPTASGKGKWRGPAVKKFWEGNIDAPGS